MTYAKDRRFSRSTAPILSFIFGAGNGALFGFACVLVTAISLHSQPIPSQKKRISVEKSAQPVPLAYGVDVFFDSLSTTYAHYVPKKRRKPLRFGLVTNHTGVDSKGIPNYQRFEASGLRIGAIFAPEHGFFGEREAGEKTKNAKIGKTPIFSLYGKTKAPTPYMLRDVDILIFDIADIGTRTYTYISTLYLVMKAALEQKKRLIVFDRPNPIAPISAQGPSLDLRFRSFVGMVEVPFIHGMTIGEIARTIQEKEMPLLNLTVVPMRGYDPTRFFDELGMTFIPPSPNIQTVNAALLYPATVLLEGTTISEGRGTEAPFEMIGAPGLDALRLKEFLSKKMLPGIAVDTISFVPRSLPGKAERPKFRDTLCTGVRFHITDRQKYQPYSLALALLRGLKSSYAPFGFLKDGQFFDRLAGNDAVRREIDAFTQE